MNYENLRNLAATVQSIVVSVAVVSGGIWAVLNLSWLQEREIAQLQLLRSRIAAEPVLQVDVSAELLEISACDLVALSTVELANVGGTPSVLSAASTSLTARELLTHGAGAGGLDEQVVSGVLIAPRGSLTVQPGRVRTLYYSLSIPRPGAYLVEFISTDENTDRKLTQAAIFGVAEPRKIPCEADGISSETTPGDAEDRDDSSAARKSSPIGRTRKQSETLLASTASGGQ